jgi:hypothetical protein
MPDSLNVRAIRERPLAKRTDDEIAALDRLGNMVHFLRDPLAERLSDLSFLASAEAAERHLREELGRA